MRCDMRYLVNYKNINGITHLREPEEQKQNKKKKKKPEEVVSHVKLLFFSTPRHTHRVTSNHLEINVMSNKEKWRNDGKLRTDRKSGTLWDTYFWANQNLAALTKNIHLTQLDLCSNSFLFYDVSNFSCTLSTH